MVRQASFGVGQKQWARVISTAAILTAILSGGVLQASIVSGVGSGDITFHSSYYTDASIAPSNTTGVVGIPQYGAALNHEIVAPGGAEHSIMTMSWNYTGADPQAFIRTTNSLLNATKLELVPFPPAGAHHSATMTGSFEILFSLDAGGLPATILPARIYKIYSYVNPAIGSPSGAAFDAHWDYTDVGFGLLGSQDITFVAPDGLGVLNSVSSLPLAISVPAGHPTLKVSGYFKLSANSDDFLGGPPPFDTLIAVVPEPASLSLAILGAVVIGGTAIGRRRKN